MCNVVTDRIDKVLILKLVKDLNVCVDIVYLQDLDIQCWDFKF